MSVARIDRWLWAVRLCKSRTAATELCRGGRVRVNGAPVKAAARVEVGDRVEVHLAGRDRVVEVREALERRVGAPRAAECYTDHSPPAPARQEGVLSRAPGAGRPTKRERRQLDRFRR